MTQTLFDKIWAAHEVADNLLYIDLHLVHEVTSPQAFDGLRLAGRPVRRPDLTIATEDHNVPTPNAIAPNAPWVDVCESPHTTVIPGWVRPSCGPMMCTMPWSWSPSR